MDYIHIVDLADAHLKSLYKIMENSSNQIGNCLIYNLGNDLGISVKRFYYRLKKLQGLKCL